MSVCTEALVIVVFISSGRVCLTNRQSHKSCDRKIK